MSNKIFVGEFDATLKHIQQEQMRDSNMCHTRLTVEMKLVDFTDLCECGFMPISHSAIEELNGQLVYIGGYQLIGVRTACVSLVCKNPVRSINEKNER